MVNVQTGIEQDVLDCINLPKFFSQQVEGCEVRRLLEEDGKLKSIRGKPFQPNQRYLISGEDYRLHALAFVEKDGLDEKTLQYVLAHLVPKVPHGEAFSAHKPENGEFRLGVEPEFIESKTCITVMQRRGKKPTLAVVGNGEPSGLVKSVYAHMQPYMPEHVKLLR